MHHQFVFIKRFIVAYITIHILSYLLHQVDKGTDDRVSVCLLKSNISREDLPEDLSEIAYPVSEDCTFFYVKSSLFTLRANVGSTSPALLSALPSGASLRGSVVRRIGGINPGSAR